VSSNRGLCLFSFSLATLVTGCTSSTQPSTTQPPQSPTHLLHVTTSATACHTEAPRGPQFVLATDYTMHVVAHPVPAQKSVSYTLLRDFTGGVPQFTDALDTGDIVLTLTTDNS